MHIQMMCMRWNQVFYSLALTVCRWWEKYTRILRCVLTRYGMLRCLCRQIKVNSFNSIYIHNHLNTTKLFSNACLTHCSVLRMLGVFNSGAHDLLHQFRFFSLFISMFNVFRVCGKICIALKPFMPWHWSYELVTHLAFMQKTSR